MSTITMSDFENNGRIGNQLFQYGSLMGIEDSQNRELRLPAWKYSEFFEGDFPQSSMPLIGLFPVVEPTYHYSDPSSWIPASNVNIKTSYLQSEKYWINSKQKILNALKFKKEFVIECLSQFPQAFEKETVAIHIRRGDYVNNPNYVSLTPLYYINALEAHFPDWENMNLIFFSDDIEYAKIHFECLENAFFSEGFTDIQDLCLMSQCANHIIANSSFSWWGAYLSHNEGKVVRPINHFAGKLKERCDDKDLYPESWIAFDDLKKKICLRDTTFIIPFFFDHQDRRNNLNLNIALLRENFYTHVTIDEFTPESPIDPFHRTKMINNVARRSSTPYIVNWDADVIVAPMQILKSIKRLRAGIDMVMPYDWRFARIPLRMDWHSKIGNSMDIGCVSGHRPSFIGFNPGDKESWGGAVFFNKQSFIKGGMENENFISFGPEDSERRERFTKLGFSIERVRGCIYHLNHFKGLNSGKKHCHFAMNSLEYKRVLGMTKDELQAYVDSWTWAVQS